MTQIFHKSPFRIVAQFPDDVLAETVCEAINEALSNAAREVDALFERQNGVANIAEVSEIYLRYGFHNDSGWQQYRPLTAENDFLFWEVPEGMKLEEAEQLIAAFGAVSLMVENDADDALLREVPHPAALFLSEIDDAFDTDDDDPIILHSEKKKTFH